MYYKLQYNTEQRSNVFFPLIIITHFNLESIFFKSLLSAFILFF